MHNSVNSKLKLVKLFLFFAASSSFIYADNKNDDAYVKEFASKLKSEYVSAHGNKLFLYAKPLPSEWFKTVTLFTMSMGLMVFCGAAAEIVADDEPALRNYALAALAIFGAFFFGEGLNEVAKLGQDADMVQFKNVIGIHFDEIGIYEWGKLKIKWIDIDKICLDDSISAYGRHVATVSFRDVKDKNLWSVDGYGSLAISRYRQNGFINELEDNVTLPLNIYDFLDIASYYLEKYNPKN